ncbi:MAG: VWA domain-containing protein [Deltaproteobacteria bacterium]|nr:VWA domain-containing protein [Deltaproteobacteria bacterium]
MASPVSKEPQQHSIESGLTTRVIQFGRVLRSHGIPVTTGRVVDAIQGLEHVEIGRRAQFKELLACVLVSNRRDLELFYRLFDAYWRRRPPDDSDESDAEKGAEAKPRTPVFPEILGVAPQDSDQLQLALFRAGLEENTAEKPFQDLSAEELFSVEQAVKQLARVIGTRISRRSRCSAKPGKLDFARTMRKSFRSWGEPVELKFKRRKRRKTRIHLLLDISGSMDAYGRFFLLFGHALARSVPRTRVFVFSTRLTEVTSLFRDSEWPRIFNKMTSSEFNWGGGTDMGNCFRYFNRNYATRFSGERTELFIAGDGWDRGDPEELENQMSLMKRSCNKLFWLNPLMAFPGYTPTCLGIRTVLPYVDALLPFYNVITLWKVLRLLETEVRAIEAQTRRMYS